MTKRETNLRSCEKDDEHKKCWYDHKQENSQEGWQEEWQEWENTKKIQKNMSHPEQCRKPLVLQCYHCTAAGPLQGPAWSAGRKGIWCTPPPAGWGRGCRTSRWSGEEVLRMKARSAGSLPCLCQASTETELIAN